MRLSFLVAFLLCSLLPLEKVLAEPLPVIPGGQGFGSTTAAGRGGTIYRVTTPADDPGAMTVGEDGTISGSLRAALEAEGPRIVVFEVGGTLVLDSPMVVEHGSLTVAGQSAPEPGIEIRGYGLEIRADDVLIQHLRLRPDRGRGDASLVIAGARNVVLDHLSLQGLFQEQIAILEGAQDISVLNCILAEGVSRRQGVLVGERVRNVTLLGNLKAHGSGKSLSVAGESRFVAANNLFFNAGREEYVAIQSGQGAEPLVEGAMAGNIFRDAPLAGRTLHAAVVVQPEIADASRLYLTNNRRLPEGVVLWDRSPPIARDSSPLALTDYFIETDLDTVQARVLGGAGARPRHRDSLDAALIHDVRSGTWTPRLLSSPPVPSSNRTLDLPIDPHGDDNGDGYTNIEHVLHAMAAALEPDRGDIVFDSFSTDKFVSSHLSDTGTGWTRWGAGGYTKGDIAIFKGTAKYNGTEVAYLSDAVPPDADYAVEADFILGSGNRRTDRLALIARGSAGAATAYRVDYNHQTRAFVLYRQLDGNFQEFGTWTDTAPLPVTHRVKLEVVGTDLSVHVGGARVIEARDASIGEAGHAGIGVAQSGSLCALDNFRVVRIAAPPDSDPVITAFSLPETSDSLSVPLTFTAQKEGGAIAGYYLSTSQETPAPSSAGWTATPPAHVTFEREGEWILYGWVKDDTGRVSERASASVSIGRPPEITAFALPPTSPSLTVELRLLESFDDFGVTGYLLKETEETPSPADPRWKSVQPQSYTFAQIGVRTLYVWIRDAGGRISAPASSSVFIFSATPAHRGASDPDIGVKTVTDFPRLGAGRSNRVYVTGPMTLSQADTEYILQNDIVAPETAFLVAANNVTLNLNGYTVTYGAADPGKPVHAVRATGGQRLGVAVVNGRIVQAAVLGADDLRYEYSHPIFGGFDAVYGQSNFRYLLVAGLDIHYRTPTTCGIYNHWGHDTEIRHNSLWDSGRRVGNRNQLWSAVKLAEGVAQSVHHNQIMNARHGGIMVKSSAKVYQNYIEVDSADTNALGINAYRGADVEVYANTIEGRGVHVAGLYFGSGGSDIRIHRNHVQTRNTRPTVSPSDGYQSSSAFRTTFGIINSEVYDNTFITWGKKDGVAPGIDTRGWTMFVGMADPGDSLLIRDNTILGLSEDGLGMAYAVGMKADSVPGVRFEGNVIESNFGNISLGDSYGECAGYPVFRENRIVRNTDHPPFPGYRTVDMNEYVSRKSTGRFISNGYQGGAAPHSVDWPSSPSTAALRDLGIGWIYTLTVKSASTGDPLSGKRVQIVDRYGAVTFEGATDPGGRIEAELIEYWITNRPVGEENAPFPGAYREEMGPYTVVVEGGEPRSVDIRADLSETVAL